MIKADRCVNSEFLDPSGQVPVSRAYRNVALEPREHMDPPKSDIMAGDKGVCS
jgi:hypothetical protein